MRPGSCTRPFLVALLVMFSPPAAAAQSPAVTVADLIRPGRITVDVMEQVMPPRLLELSARLQQAMQADPAWWQAQARQTPPGQPIPYDARMGLSEEEYREFLALPSEIRLRPALTETLVIEATEAGYRFTDDSGVVPLRGFEIDTVRDVVVTPFGELPATAPIVASAAQQVTGPWGGPRWMRESIDAASGTGLSASLAIGRHENGRTVIYLDVRRVAGGQDDRVNILLFAHASR